MSDFLSFLYEGYIRPYLDRQPRDDGDTFRHSLCEGSQTEETQKDVDAVVAFAAAHAFLLGVRTGAGLRQSGVL
ncbi:hypothetical protein [Flavonifractor sp. AGMB03687]|uniref:hypothetical protein n=1 Tax=Flavonifractor sp. AGMB03687 TaxID=2785133 RepID=UPI001ADFA9A5|nr:hypothetical protein [Flavonifractor sp. AGMB03687]